MGDQSSLFRLGMTLWDLHSSAASEVRVLLARYKPEDVARLGFLRFLGYCPLLSVSVGVLSSSRANCEDWAVAKAEIHH